MIVSYDPALVVLSVLVAIQGGYVSLQLARRVARANGLKRKALLAGSASALGCGIWAMHFIGMLAFQLPVAISYDVLLTLISFLVAILVTGVGVYIASFQRLTPSRLVGGGLFMGVGISTMHYIGMAAVRANCLVTYSPPLVTLSVAIGVVASALALWLAFAHQQRWHAVAGAAVMGLAISGMHYTAMAAANFTPVHELITLAAPAISQDLLAIAVAVAAFLICGFFLLVVLPDPPGRETLAATDAAPASDGLGRPRPFVRLPVEKNKMTVLLDPNEIFSIHAEEHYTRVFDGKETYFCAHPVSELEARLDPNVFIRVHRSHIVNIHHARGFRKMKERGMILLDGETALTIPVSRRNIPKLQAALGL